MDEYISIPEDVQEAVDGVVPDADIRLLAFSDLNPDGSFGEQFLALAGERLLIFGHNGEAPEVRTDLALSRVSKVEIETLVGGAALRAVVDGHRVDLLSFSHAMSDAFGRVRIKLDALIDGKPLPEVKERAKRCATCGLFLGEYTRVCPRCLRKGATLRRLLGYTKPYTGRMVLIGCLMTGGIVAGLVPPYLTAILVDDVLSPRANYNLVIWLVIGLASTSLAHTGLEIWRNRVTAWLGARISFDIRAQLYERLQWLSMRYYDHHPTGTIISRLTQDANGIQDLLAFALPFVLVNLVTIAAVSVVLLAMNWQLALIAMLPLPFLFVIVRKLWRLLRRAFHNWWYRWGRFHTLVSDALGRVKVTKAFSQQQSEITRYDIRNDDLRAAGAYADATAGTFFPLMWLIIGSGSLLVWYFGSMLHMHLSITLGTIIAFLAYLAMVQHPLAFLGQSTQWITRALTAAERVFEVLDAESDSERGRGDIELEEIHGEVEYRNVGFGYEKHQQVLKDISFQVKPGQMLGLVGKSGAGKSSIINLLCRFYDADEGEIFIDGIPLRDVSLWSYRGKLGVVLQEPFLFSGTIAENIAYAKPDAAPEEIMAAAKIANAHDFIISKPDGYDEQVGERGNRLSGGEKQRVCIARAILHDPAILILDEATASVDLETEQQIQEAVARLIKGRTTFAIAHRLSTLRNAHQLLVLDEGRVVESGTHDDLEAKKGVYAKLLDIHRQTSMIGAING
ncbi:MAG TPA: ABC transporter ATP-binding protein [Dehalococcoidia bacterium]|nr:ABC transporter ATP-binding protein [Dehalococcoidia bacterium]